LHINNVELPSRTPSELPEGTWWHYPGDSNGLSKGVIAGIVAGAVAGVGALGGLATWWWLRRRGCERAGENGHVVSKLQKRKGDEEREKPLMPAEADGAAMINELSPEDRKPELDPAAVMELSGTGKPAELGSRAVYELSGIGKMS